MFLTYPNKRRREPPDPVPHLSKPPITWRHSQHSDDVTRFETELFWVHGHVIPQRFRECLWYIHLSRNRKWKSEHYKGVCVYKKQLALCRYWAAEGRSDIAGFFGSVRLFFHSCCHHKYLRDSWRKYIPFALSKDGWDKLRWLQGTNFLNAATKRDSMCEWKQLYPYGPSPI